MHSDVCYVTARSSRATVLGLDKCLQSASLCVQTLIKMWQKQEKTNSTFTHISSE